jgi:hypothetical protein
MMFTEQICKLENLRTRIITSIGGLTITIQEFEGMLKEVKEAACGASASTSQNAHGRPCLYL